MKISVIFVSLRLLTCVTFEMNRNENSFRIFEILSIKRRISKNTPWLRFNLDSLLNHDAHAYNIQFYFILFPLYIRGTFCMLFRKIGVLVHSGEDTYSPYPPTYAIATIRQRGRRQTGGEIRGKHTPRGFSKPSTRTCSPDKRTHRARRVTPCLQLMRCITHASCH